MLVWQVCTLADLDYDVFHATVDSRSGVAEQEYFVRPRFGEGAPAPLLLLVAELGTCAAPRPCTAASLLPGTSAVGLESRQMHTTCSSGLSHPAVHLTEVIFCSRL